MTKREFIDILQQCKPPFRLLDGWLEGAYYGIHLSTMTKNPPRRTMTGRICGSKNYQVAIHTLRRKFVVPGKEKDTFHRRMDACLAKYKRWLDEYMEQSRSSSGSGKG